MQRLRANGVRSTIQFFGSARAKDRVQFDSAMATAASALSAAEVGSRAHSDAEERVGKLKQIEWMVPYMADIQELARRITEWSQSRRAAQLISGVDRTKSALRASFERGLNEVSWPSRCRPAAALAPGCRQGGAPAPPPRRPSSRRSSQSTSRRSRRRPTPSTPTRPRPLPLPPRPSLPSARRPRRSASTPTCPTRRTTATPTCCTSSRQTSSWRPAAGPASWRQQTAAPRWCLAAGRSGWASRCRLRRGSTRTSRPSSLSSTTTSSRASSRWPSSCKVTRLPRRDTLRSEQRRQAPTLAPRPASLRHRLRRTPPRLDAPHTRRFAGRVADCVLCLASPRAALVAAPGGFGTMDELFELMTLKQTGKMNSQMPIVLFGKKVRRTDRPRRAARVRRDRVH